MEWNADCVLKFKEKKLRETHRYVCTGSVMEQNEIASAEKSALDFQLPIERSTRHAKVQTRGFIEPQANGELAAPSFNAYSTIHWEEKVSIGLQSTIIFKI
jgi:hypothetical protein